MIPVLIVVVLFLATARVIHAVEDARMPGGHNGSHGRRSSVLVGVSVSAAGLHNRQRVARSGQRPAASDAHAYHAAVGRHRSQLLGAKTGRQDRPDSQPHQQHVDRSARNRGLRGPVRAVLRHPARQDACCGSLCSRARTSTAGWRSSGSQRGRSATTSVRAARFSSPRLASTAIPYPAPTPAEPSGPT